jgi:hypothetical protein
MARRVEIDRRVRAAVAEADAAGSAEAAADSVEDSGALAEAADSAAAIVKTCGARWKRCATS